MTQMIKWPSIEQYRNVVKTVQMKTRYRGKDENGEPIFDALATLPVLRFEGTVKLHGTNASVCMAQDGNMWVQSRENIITPEKDNAGFAMFVEANKDAFMDLLLTGLHIKRFTSTKDTVVVFGEWCGGSIQKGVAISKLPKTFVIFGMALVDEEGNKTFFTRQEVVDTCDGCRDDVKKPQWTIPERSEIYCIYDFPTYTIDIDFENPHESQNELNELTTKVGDECPVGYRFGIENEVGEGIVWRCVEEGFEDSGFWFKVKDERHSNSKVKTLATVDVERINNIKELSERLAHNGRLEQGKQVVFGIDNEVDVKKIGEYIQWVMRDIAKEDLDVIAASGFTMKEISGPVSKIARDIVLKAF